MRHPLSYALILSHVRGWKSLVYASCPSALSPLSRLVPQVLSSPSFCLPPSLPKTPESLTTLETALSIKSPPALCSRVTTFLSGSKGQTLCSRLPLSSLVDLLSLDSVHSHLVSLFSQNLSPAFLNRSRRLSSCQRRHLLLYHEDPKGTRYMTLPYSCNLPVCPSCSRRRSLEFFHRLSGLLVHLRSCRPLGNLRHVVLTVKNVPHGALYDSCLAMLKAFHRMGRNPDGLWQSHFLGGVWKLEITYSKKTKSWHPHIHCLAEGDYWRREGLSETWSRFVSQRGLFADPRLSCHISLVKGDDPASLSKAILEVTKYIVKPLEQSLPSSVVCEITDAIHIPRGSSRKRLRMAGFFGSWQYPNKKKDPYWESAGSLWSVLNSKDSKFLDDPSFLASILKSVCPGSVDFLTLTRSYPMIADVSSASSPDS